jgi:RNA polymerase sigma factor (sigma-70 family)
MATAKLGTLVQHIHRLAGASSSSERKDSQLLHEFSARSDEAAFALLVARHGLMVLRVCRRVLNHEQDAEDAFQATFLVLARNARAIRKPEALAGWLHGVAYRTAMKAKRSAARRRNHEAKLREGRTDLKSVSPNWDDVQAVLDVELQALPQHYRTALVLCVLEGKSVPEAAAALGCKLGTVSSWLTRARQRLRQRLERRGIKLAALLLAMSVAQSAGKAAVPVTLANATIRFGLWVAAGEPAAEVIPTHIAALAAGVTRAMLVTKAKLAVGLILAACIVTAACGLAYSSAADDQATETKRKPVEQNSSVRQEESKNQETITCSGRVLDPDGNPVRGAKLMFLENVEETLPNKVWATSGPDGHFQFTVSRLQMANRRWGMSGESGHVMAAAPGYGFALARLSRPERAQT